MPTYPSIAPMAEGKVKDGLGIVGTSDDDILFDLVGAATRVVEEIVGPVIERAPITVFATPVGRVARLAEFERPGNLSAATVAEWQGSSFVDLVDDTDYIAPIARGSSTVKAGRFHRISSSRHERVWPEGLQTVRVTAWTPGRFGTTAACEDSNDGYTITQAFWMIVKHFWASYTTQGVALDDDYQTVRPVWPGFGVPNAARDMLVEHAPAKSMMAGYHGS